MALAITRQPGESFTTGGCVEVKVVRVRGDRVRLAITAPPDVPILRDDAGVRKAREAIARGNIAEVREQMDYEDN